MSRPTCISEAWEAYAADQPITAATPNATVKARRDFYSGAIGVLMLLKAGVKPEALMSEILAYGRTIGTAAETAN